jgi:hypothetical protein
MSWFVVYQDGNCNKVLFKIRRLMVHALELKKNVKILVNYFDLQRVTFH